MVSKVVSNGLGVLTTGYVSHGAFDDGIVLGAVVDSRNTLAPVVSGDASESLLSGIPFSVAASVSVLVVFVLQSFAGLELLSTLFSPPVLSRLTCGRVILIKAGFWLRQIVVDVGRFRGRCGGRLVGPRRESPISLRDAQLVQRQRFHFVYERLGLAFAVCAGVCVFERLSLFGASGKNSAHDLRCGFSSLAMAIKQCSEVM